MLRLTKYEVALVLLFIFTLPLSNPWVRGDGVGYYAFARSLVTEHNLDFREDWLKANNSFRMGRMDAHGNVAPDQYTPTGHLNNHFSVGPAILWSPFLIAAHTSVLLWDHFGGRSAADGYSRPHLVAMAFATALYGFLAVVISFLLARRYVAERWAFLAALGIWFGSSLPVYMYFNPSWSHAQSAFTVSLFTWYWLRTRGVRTWTQWLVLGGLGGLMMDVYYISAVVLLFPLLECLASYVATVRKRASEPAGPLLLKNVVFAAALMAAFLPTLVTKKVIYGSYFRFGYAERWFWNSPAFFKVSFSPDHGLFSWTPILILAVAGLWLLRKYDRALALYSIAVFVGYLYAIGCYQDWDGISSFGNRFFVSLTPLFILGLGALFDRLASTWQEQRAAILVLGATGVLILWNLGLIFQWGLHLIPPRGPISWRDAAYNQVTVVPAEAASAAKLYLTRRKKLMEHIEQTDVNQRNSRQSEGTE